MVAQAAPREVKSTNRMKGEKGVFYCVVGLSALCCVTNTIMNECMHMTDGSNNEVCVQLTSMVDFDWLGVLLGSAFVSVLACALLAKIMFLALPNIAGGDLCLLW